MKTHLFLSALALSLLAAQAHSQTSQILIDWSHSWKFFHPMGTFPAPAGNFLTTWYLADALYNSPLPFGPSTEIVGVSTTADSYDTGNGGSPLGYGTLDYIGNAGVNARFAQTVEPSLFTIPPDTGRRTAYFKTTFTVPAGGAATPKLEFLMDDGGYIYLDGTQIATVNITAGVADTYDSVATNATNTETDTFTLDLGIGGTRNLSGSVLATRTMPVNVISPVGFLAAGTHTLAISLHNNAVNSSDLALATKLTGTVGGCAFSAASGPVTRDFNGTTGNPNDDFISADITVNSGSGNAPTWNVTANAPGVPANPASGSYNTTRTFTFPVSTISGGDVIVTIADGNNSACTVPVTLTVPPAPYVLGKKRLGGVESDIISAAPLATGWRSTTPLVFTNNGGGNDRNTQELRSEPIDLTGEARPVTVVATFVVQDTSTTSNFETNDNFSAEVYLDGSVTPVNMMDPALDKGNGAASHVSGTDNAPVANGAADGRLNGYSGLAYDDTSAANADITALQDYNANKERDEFNVDGQTGELASWTKTFDIVYTVPDAVNSLVLSFRGGNDSAAEVFTLSGIRVRNGTCDIAAAPTGITRGAGLNVGDPADDTINFNLTVTGTGSTWTYGTFSGTYGTATPVRIPVSQSGLPQTVADGFDLSCTTTFTVTAPQPNLVVTNTTAVGTDFTLAAATNAQAYVRTAGGTELGWTGGDADVRATNQPAPNTTARYLDLNGDTTVGADFLTEPAVISTSVEYVRASVDLGAYTTSGTEFEDDDDTVIAVETSDDPSFPSPTQYFLVGTAFPAAGAVPPGPGGIAFYDAFKVSSPDAINYGTAAVPYPTADFALTRRSVTFPRGGNSYIRLRLRAGPSAGGSEHAIVDNIRFEKGTCALSATPVVTRNNGGDNDPSNDVFSADVTVTAVANGASSGWNSATSPFLGTYNVAVTFGPYPVSGGPQTLNVADALDPACSLTFTLTPPACVLIADTAGITITRAGEATLTLADDTLAFDLVVTATNGGTGWTSNLPIPGAPGTFYSGNYGAVVPVVIDVRTAPGTVVVTDSADTNCVLQFTLAIPNLPNYSLGTVIPLASAPSLFGSLGVAATNGWKNPDDGVLTMDNPGGTTHVITSAAIDAQALGELHFTADLIVSETSETSNFEAADTFKLTITYENALGQFPVNVTKPFDVDNNDIMNGYDDIPATPYDTNRQLDEFNRPLPGLALAGQINHTFALSTVIPADADFVYLEVQGLNNSATEHYRLANVRFTEQLPDSNADGDGDGQSNASEVVAGTDPNDPKDFLHITGIARNGAGADITFPSKASHNYRAEVSNSLTGVWTPFGNVIAGTGSPVTASIPQVPLPGESKYFLRVRVVP